MSSRFAGLHCRAPSASTTSISGTRHAARYVSRPHHRCDFCRLRKLICWQRVGLTGTRVPDSSDVLQSFRCLSVFQISSCLSDQRGGPSGGFPSKLQGAHLLLRSNSVNISHQTQKTKKKLNLVPTFYVMSAPPCVSEMHPTAWEKSGEDHAFTRELAVRRSTGKSVILTFIYFQIFRTLIESRISRSVFRNCITYIQHKKSKRSLPFILLSVSKFFNMRQFSMEI